MSSAPPESVASASTRSTGASAHSTGASAHSTGASARAGDLEAYYTRYYRDALGIPDWRALVAVRLADDAYERARLARLETALGRPVRGLRLLNVGCGTGGFNAAAESAGADVWGVDADAEAVGLARRRVRRALVGAGEALPFAAASFDVVYCFSTLEHLADAAHGLSEMLRVLRPGGELYLHAPSRWACFESHYKVVWLPGLPRWAGRCYLKALGRPTAFLDSLRLPTARRCRRLLAQAGARAVRVLEGDRARPVAGRAWPLVRAYYRAFGVRPYVELVAVKDGVR
jgi:SAM-dependent methyltransferase